MDAMEVEQLLPTQVQDLPEDHIFRQIYRGHIPNDDAIDIDYVIARLQTPEGMAETRQWVQTASHSGRLFLHQLLDCNFTEYGIRDDRATFFDVNAEAGLLAVRLALDAYPDSIQLVDSTGYLPLHITCAKSMWKEEISKQLFDFLLDKHPGGACALTASSESVLSCVLKNPSNSLQTESPAADRDRDAVLMTLLDLFPSAVEIPDSDGGYPLHHACHLSAANQNVVKRLIKLYPQALEKKGWGGRTPLQCFLRCGGGNWDGIARMLISASPASTMIEDSSVLVYYQDLDPTGDSLDYSCVTYIDELKGFGYAQLVYDGEEVDDYMECAGGFALASEEYLMKQAQTAGQNLYVRWHQQDDSSYSQSCRYCEGQFELILRICQLQDGSVPFRPLHAFCKGRRCRPWYLAVMDQIIKRYPTQATEKDEDNNLPIHLFLQSCMVEKERAKAKGYIEDDDEYFRAVQICFKLILDAYPGAANERNEDGLLPIHIAIWYCIRLKFESILQPLLEVAPTSLLSRDSETRLHPFAQASIGMNSNIDTAFILLRRDPSVLAALGF